MAFTIAKGYTFGATELVTNTKLHALIDDAVISGNPDSYTSIDIQGTSVVTGQLDVSGTLTGAGTITFTNLSATNFTGTTTQATTANITTLSSTTAKATYAIVTGLTGTTVQATTGNITTLSSTTTKATNAIVTGLTATSLGVTNLLAGTARAGDLYYDDGTKMTRLSAGSNGEILYCSGTSNAPFWSDTSAGGSASTVNATFLSSDLTDGKLTVSHGLSLTTPFALILSIYDSAADEIVPDNVSGGTLANVVNLRSYTDITGTWGYRYV